MKFIYRLGASVTQLCKLGAPTSSLTEYVFDKLTLGASKEN